MNPARTPGASERIAVGKRGGLGLTATRARCDMAFGHVGPSALRELAVHSDEAVGILRRSPALEASGRYCSAEKASRPDPSHGGAAMAARTAEWAPGACHAGAPMSHRLKHEAAPTGWQPIVLPDASPMWAKSHCARTVSGAWRKKHSDAGKKRRHG